MSATQRVFVAGHRGMVGSAVCRKLAAKRGVELITKSKSELDLTDRLAVGEFFAREEIDQVYLAAAKVGGIHANNSSPAEFIYENLAIESNIIDCAHRANVQHLLFFGSSCIYPKYADQPIAESSLLTGALEPTNEPYAIAKIAGIKLCESYNRQYGRSYRSVMPTNLYGPNDSFHPENSHVIPGLMRRFHEAKLAGEDEVVVWGSGNPRREFLHVDDLAEASVHVMELKESDYLRLTEPMMSHINIGTGQDCSIRELAELLSDVIGYSGKLTFDRTKPDGTPRKLLDVTRIKAMGWEPKIPFRDGLKQTYEWFCSAGSGIRL